MSEPAPETDLGFPSYDGPSLEDITKYLDEAGVSYDATSTTLFEAIQAEADEQRARCRFPVDPDGLSYFTFSHVEALKRRVAHNLAVRPLPLGVQATITDVGSLATFVGGLDAEVSRFEKRWRKRLIG